jgi:hypothetical protein
VVSNAQKALDLLGAAMNAIDGETMLLQIRRLDSGERRLLSRSFLLEGLSRVVSFVGKSFENRSVGRWESKSLTLASPHLRVCLASRIVGFLVDSLRIAAERTVSRTSRFCRDFIIYSSTWWKPSFKACLSFLRLL